MSKLYLVIILILLSSCSLGKSVVDYDEMCKKPELSLQQTILTIKTVNSCINSSLLIYKIDYTVNTENKSVLITAYQAPGKTFKTEFNLDLSRIATDNLKEYNYFWINSDGRKTELKIN